MAHEDAPGRGLGRRDDDWSRSVLIRVARALLWLLLPFAVAVSFCAFAVGLVHGFHGFRLDRPGVMLMWFGLVLLPAWIVFGLAEARASLPRLAFVHLIAWLVLGTFASTILR